MDSLSALDITIITSLTVGTLSLFFREAGKQLIQKVFSNMSKGQVNVTFLLLVIILVITAAIVVPQAVIQATPETPVVQEKKSTFQKRLEDVKSGAEVLAPIIKDFSENGKLKDSIRNANKEPRWVVQIGDITSNRNQLSKAVLALEEKIEGLKVFKEYNKGFRIILDFGLSQEEAKAQEKEIQNKLEVHLTKVSTINLSDYCKPKHEIKQGKETRIRRSDQKLITLECN